MDLQVQTSAGVLRTLQKLPTRNKVTLYWVPGHKGIEGNKKADELALKGTYIGTVVMALSKANFSSTLSHTKKPSVIPVANGFPNCSFWT